MEIGKNKNKKEQEEVYMQRVMLWDIFSIILITAC